MGAGASDVRNKEGRKLIKAYQKKHRSLTESKDDRHMRRLFNSYGGKKGYLDEREAKLFIKDVLFVCEVTKEPDLNATIEGIFHELDPLNTNRVAYQELLKPSWGKVQDLLHTVYSKINTLKNINSTDTSLQDTPISSPITTAMQTPTSSQPAFFRPIKEHSGDLSESELEDCCPPSFICPISQEMMTDPVILVETKTTYDRPSIEQWLQKHATDPSTGLEIKSKEILSVLALRNAIEEWTSNTKEQQKKKKEHKEAKARERAEKEKIKEEQEQIEMMEKEKKRIDGINDGNRYDGNRYDGN